MSDASTRRFLGFVNSLPSRDEYSQTFETVEEGHR